MLYNLKVVCRTTCEVLMNYNIIFWKSTVRALPLKNTNTQKICHIRLNSIWPSIQLILFSVIIKMKNRNFPHGPFSCYENQHMYSSFHSDDQIYFFFRPLQIMILNNTKMPYMAPSLDWVWVNCYWTVNIKRAPEM